MRSTMLIAVVAGATVMITGCEEQPTFLDAREAAASLAPAPDASADRSGFRGGRRGGNPVGMLLAQKEELELTTSQVDQLERIGLDLAAKNRPLLEAIGADRRREGRDHPALEGLSAEARRAKLNELREARRAEMQQLSAEERRALREERRARLEAVRPQMEQVRANTRAAAEAAFAVLSAEQRAELRSIVEARRSERGGPTGRTGHRPGRRGQKA